VHIIITRPKEDAINLIGKLKQLGHVATHLPLIKIKKIETKKINLENYKAIIFTSSNAVKFMSIKKFNLKIKCFCVGNATEVTAKQAGFINTYSSGGTVDSLIELVIRTQDKKSGKLLYLSSEFISKDLDKELVNEGFSVDRVSNYTSLPIEQIDETVLNIFKTNPPDVFFIYSVRSANNLFNLINKYSLLNLVTQSNLMCISEKVLLELNQIKWKKVLIFNPGEEEFLLNKIK
jgi:uroporphyrinogen-III synthase